MPKRDAPNSSCSSRASSLRSASCTDMRRSIRRKSSRFGLRKRSRKTVEFFADALQLSTLISARARIGLAPSGRILGQIMQRLQGEARGQIEQGDDRDRMIARSVVRKTRPDQISATSSAGRADMTRAPRPAPSMTTGYVSTVFAGAKSQRNQ